MPTLPQTFFHTNSPAAVKMVCSPEADWGINDTSQAVYTISTKSLTFLSEGEMDPTSLVKSGIALLNYKTNTLIVLGNANAQGLVTTRTEIDLATGHTNVHILQQAGDPVASKSAWRWS